MGIILVHVLIYCQMYYSEEVVQNPPSLHLLRKIETRVTDEKFPSVMGECVI
jgi:hypothetical protein